MAQQLRREPAKAEARRSGRAVGARCFGRRLAANEYQVGPEQRARFRKRSVSRRVLPGGEVEQPVAVAGDEDGRLLVLEERNARLPQGGELRAFQDRLAGLEPEGPRGLDERLLAEHEHLASRQPRVQRPRDDGHADVDAGEAGPLDRDDGDHEHEKRERVHGVDGAHHERVEPASVPAGERADGDADDERRVRDHERDLEVELERVQDAREHVPTERVGAHQVRPRGRLQLVGEVEGGRVVGGHPAGGEAEDEQRAQDPGAGVEGDVRPAPLRERRPSQPGRDAGVRERGGGRVGPRAHPALRKRTRGSIAQ